MSCYCPKKAFQVGFTDSGRPKYAICGYDVKFVEVDEVGRWSASVDPNAPYIGKRRVSEYRLVPCGKCIGCRLDYASQWSKRMMLENLYHDCSYFITLTYDDEHLETLKSYSVDDDTGEYHDRLSLNPRDWTLFMKRLRSAVEPDKLRFFMCGEYGDTTFRPHFHAIIFGLKLDDLVLYKKTDDGFLYTSEFLASIWQKGFVTVGEVTEASCGYVARYALKKQLSDDSPVNQKYFTLGLVPPFTRASRRPGLGAQYYYDNYDKVFVYDKINIATEKSGLSFIPPKYFERLYLKDNNSDFIDCLHDKRRYFAESAFRERMRMSDKSDIEILESERINHDARVRKLKNRDI